MRRTNWIGLLAIVILLAACQPEPQDITGAYNVTPVILTEPPAVTVTPSLPASAVPQSPATSTQASYPGPTPIVRGYPGQTVYPTLDPTIAEETRQAVNATSTADTAALLLTATAEEAALPTSASVSTSTPDVAPTLEVVRSAPDCAPGADTIACHDAVLRFRFSYPYNWGAISAEYSAGETGHAYRYTFSGTALRLQAGGDSRDYGEGREAMLTDFNGFGTNANWGPDSFFLNGGVISYAVQSQVALSLIVPAASYVCDPGPSSLYAPIGIVAINLPDNPQINGFVFAADLLADSRWQAIADTLGVGNKVQDTRCPDPAARRQFDDQIAALLAALKAHTADADTQSRVDALMHLAQSIHFN